MSNPMIVGTEWLVEARNCNANILRDERALRFLFRAIIEDLGLKTLGKDVWHKFPGAGGVTGLVALTESHLACHTYPEHKIATFNLYCCKTRPEWNWRENLTKMLEAEEVLITKIERGDKNLRFKTQDSKSEIKTTESAIKTPQSAIRNPQSETTGGIS